MIGCKHVAACTSEGHPPSMLAHLSVLLDNDPAHCPSLTDVMPFLPFPLKSRCSPLHPLAFALLPCHNVTHCCLVRIADILDPALMRSGRLDRKIEFPHPNEDARAKILRIHSRKMSVSPEVRVGYRTPGFRTPG